MKSFSSYLCFDGKVLKIGKEKRTLLWASDAVNGKLLCYQYAKREDSSSAFEFLNLIKNALPDKVRGITTDFGRGKCFITPIKTEFPDALHQICHVHFLRYLYIQIPKTRKSRYFWRNNIFKATVKAIVKSPTEDDARLLLMRLLALKSFFKASYHKRFLKSLEKNLSLLLAYKKSLDLPSNYNIIESWNRTLNRKLKNMDGFKSENPCKAFLKLWFEAQTALQ